MHQRQNHKNTDYQAIENQCLFRTEAGLEGADDTDKVLHRAFEFETGSDAFECDPVFKHAGESHHRRLQTELQVLIFFIFKHIASLVHYIYNAITYLFVRARHQGVAPAEAQMRVDGRKDRNDGRYLP